ncbi:MAG: hypothetical protein LBG48_04620 [Rickettsiales bacterium]|jgi:hypothetical protein|nr:hypothetical protein [Rickettsiales bacterium]
MYKAEEKRREGLISITKGEGPELFSLVPVYPVSLPPSSKKIDPILPGVSDYKVQFLMVAPGIDLKKFSYAEYINFLKKKKIDIFLKEHSEWCVAQAISDIKPSELAKGNLDLGIDSEFVFIYSVACPPLLLTKEKTQIPIKCHAFGLFGEFGGMPRDGAFDTSAFMAILNQIPKIESKYACIFLEHGGHVSVLTVVLDDRSMLYSFDSMGIGASSHSPILSHLPVKPLNTGRIQPSSGCGYIAMKFATILVKEQDMGKAIGLATDLGHFLMTEKNPQRVQERLGKEFGVEKELLQIMTKKHDKSKDGKKGGGHGDYSDLTSDERSASPFISEEDVQYDTGEDSAKSVVVKDGLEKSFLEREKLRRHNKKLSPAGILFTKDSSMVKPSVFPKRLKRSNSMPSQKMTIDLS